MSGHSHWATIKRKKSAVDAKRGKIFTRLIKEITVAARSSGGDAASNPRLRQLIDKAKEANMPHENITRAIKRGTGELPGVNYESIMYEGYGPHGIAVLVETLTDNKNRTVSDMRNVFSKGGGSLAETGSVAWMFERLGVVRVEGANEDQLLELLLDFDIKNITEDEGTFSISCDPKNLEEIKKVLSDTGLKIVTAEVEWVAQNTIPLKKEVAEKAYAFLETIEDHDDVQDVFTNIIEEE